MKTIYIKFIHPEDVYVVEPSYDLRLSPDDYVPPKICGKCGDTLFVPVSVSKNTTVSIPLGEIYRPFPKEDRTITVRGVPDLPTLTVFRELSPDEQKRLKSVFGVVFVDHKGFVMIIEAASNQPPEHRCKDAKER